ncbi:MAG TPA: hypothetical protein GX712_01575 [Bacteroidales bacterium]|nr:hypothetical protein [Bacteroidales bacterium]
MSEHDDLLERLRQTLNQQEIDSFHILEDLVPLDIQMDYFKYFDNLRKENPSFDKDEEVSILFSPGVDIERKKKSLTLLASIPDVGAYRTIETYHSSPADKELAHWSSMALVSSRIILTSDLSGQQQIYVSSGLGGQDRKLRFFSLFTTSNRQEFTDLQKEMIEREFTFHLNSIDVIIEQIDIKSNYFTLLILFPFDEDIKSRLNSAVKECNQYGNFLDARFLFTNVKILNEKEIETLLGKK